MKRKCRWMILAVLATILVSGLAFSQQRLCLSGSCYVVDRRIDRSVPAVGFNVYIYSKSTGWIGPSIIDSYGRYAFYNAPPGRYLMRIYQQKRHVWEQGVVVPGTVEQIVLR